MNSPVLRTVIPIVILIGIGFFARRKGILRAGDERVLSAYIYYFALPALFLINLSEIGFTQKTLRFIISGVVPVFVIVAIYILLYLVFKFKKQILYLLIFCTVFGNVAFFGIPFIMFAFPTDYGEHLAILSSAFISVAGVTVSITVLELYRLGKSTVWEGLKTVLKRFSKNPLVISILLGVILSLAKLKFPSLISTVLHMLGKTTTTVAIFMLGVFLYGRSYKNISRAFKLSLLRILILPFIAFFSVRFFKLSDIESST